ncbi:hypothetical protein ACFQ51_50320 [Streptomyces kaempferi]
MRGEPQDPARLDVLGDLVEHRGGRDRVGEIRHLSVEAGAHAQDQRLRRVRRPAGAPARTGVRLGDGRVRARVTPRQHGSTEETSTLIPRAAGDNGALAAARSWATAPAMPRASCAREVMRSGLAGVCAGAALRRPGRVRWPRRRPRRP